jgi:hypothetical protein
MHPQLLLLMQTVSGVSRLGKVSSLREFGKVMMTMRAMKSFETSQSQRAFVCRFGASIEAFYHSSRSS